MGWPLFFKKTAEWPKIIHMLPSLSLIGTATSNVLFVTYQSYSCSPLGQSITVQMPVFITLLMVNSKSLLNSLLSIFHNNIIYPPEWALLPSSLAGMMSGKERIRIMWWSILVCWTFWSGSQSISRHIYWRHGMRSLPTYIYLSSFFCLELMAPVGLKEAFNGRPPSVNSGG